MNSMMFALEIKAQDVSFGCMLDKWISISHSRLREVRLTGHIEAGNKSIDA
jgi:hypothetical protein